jgi:hypothetical protein
MASERAALTPGAAICAIARLIVPRGIGEYHDTHQRGVARCRARRRSPYPGAFDTTIEGNDNIEDGFYAALDAAAPDADFWKRGELVLLSQGKLTNHDTKSDGWFARLKNKFHSFDGKPVDSIRTLITQRSRSTQPGKE